MGKRERFKPFFLYISGKKVGNCLKLTLSHLQQMVYGNSFAWQAIFALHELVVQLIISRLTTKI